jgi:hypothetical protein
MSEDHLVVLACYGSRDEAELAASRLRAGGIESVITADDLGGMIPAGGISGGVKLMVASSVADEAAGLIDVEAPMAEGPRAQDVASTTPLRGERSSLSHFVMFACLAIGVLLGVVGGRVWQAWRDHGEQTYRLDTNFDGRTDETWLYCAGDPVQRTMDLNHDGTCDHWEYYHEGTYWRTESDRNFDGRLDYWATNHARIAQTVDWADTDFNGIPDVESLYLCGNIQRSDWRPNGSTNVVKREMYSDGVPTEELHDRDGDGRFEFSIRFDFMANPISSNAIPHVLQTEP